MRIARGGERLLNWIEIDREALAHNVEQFRERLGGALLGAVVKSNGYGHGLLPAADAFASAGADWLCVNSLDEAIALREAGHELPVLVMGYVPLDRLGALIDHDLRPVVFNLQTLRGIEREAERRGRTQAVHLKLETGTQRQGIPANELAPFIDTVVRSPHLLLEGLTTHYANIEDTTEHAFARRQYERFLAAVRSLEERGVEIAIRHTACSAAAILFSHTHMEMARVGISLYGIWPSKETLASCLELHRPRLDLRPALTWKTRVAQVKHVPEGEFVGYGCTYRTTRDSRIAVLPVGYHEGYDRGLSGVAHALIRGRRAPVRGRVCMNITMVDVTDIPGVSLEDEVVLLGAQGEERITAEQLAGWCGTIAYEIVARIHPGIPRV